MSTDKSPKTGWYFFNHQNEQADPIEEPALTGYVTAVEQLITDEIDYTTACPDSYGQQYLRPGQEEADMILMGLQPGAYFLVCDVATPAGHAHQAHGMVAQATVD